MTAMLLIEHEFRDRNRVRRIKGQLGHPCRRREDHDVTRAGLARAIDAIEIRKQTIDTLRWLILRDVALSLTEYGLFYTAVEISRWGIMTGMGSDRYVEDRLVTRPVAHICRSSLWQLLGLSDGS